MKRQGYKARTRIVTQPSNDSKIMQEDQEIRSIISQLDNIKKRSTKTEERLNRIEKIKYDSPEITPEEETLASVVPDYSKKPARPPVTTVYKKPKPKTMKIRNCDVTADDIFEALMLLKDEISILTSNQDEMVQQINTIKSLIQ